MPSSITEIVAWWGAILSTVVFAWDVIKWRLAGPKLRLSVNSGMESVGIPEYEGHTLISATVVNYGDRPTTLTHMVFAHYKNFWNLLRNRTDKNVFVGNPNLSSQMPYELGPGAMWNGIAFQDKIIETATRHGYLVCQIFHSHRKRPVKKRVIMK